MIKYVKFRPSSRLITTIGEEIIKDAHAAILELVKNSYDADATDCTIEINVKENFIKLDVRDNGHGMSEKDILEKWLVPSTDDKLSRRVSPLGRPMLGRKGIGRFASAILGDSVELNTVNSNSRSKLKLNWKGILENTYLDETTVELENYNDESPNSAAIKVLGGGDRALAWTDIELDKLHKELRRLITPFRMFQEIDDSNDFRVVLKISSYNSEKYSFFDKEILPLPLITYFDYRIKGIIDSKGGYKLNFSNKYTRESETLEGVIPSREGFVSHGKTRVLINIYDRDPSAIDRVVEVLKSEEISAQKNESKRILNDVSGIGIHRNGFRIRPYGEMNYDWLRLDLRRVNQPSYKISTNQVSGYIGIDEEEKSKLLEQSARDGLKDNIQYKSLVTSIQFIISLVENKRYSFRKKSGIGRKTENFSNEFHKLSDYSDIKEKISQEFKENNFGLHRYEKIKNIIDDDAIKKEKIVRKLEKRIAIYQGQATLGKIMDLVIHEIRKPISWFKNQSKTLEFYVNDYMDNESRESLLKVVEIISGSYSQADLINDLFLKLDPLATRNIKSKNVFSIKNIINVALGVFETQFNKNQIKIELSISEMKICGWQKDILVALTNILENALYWVKNTRCSERIIGITAKSNEEGDVITVFNNGPHIMKDLIEGGVLFEPGITAKPNGTGVGLSIAGEAIKRNDGRLTAGNIEEGVEFKIEFDGGIS